ncbi:hypothetical protein ABPG73_014541 [Tetrahymena malaccensis]
MNFTRLDLFSTQFNFNLGNLNSKQGTFIGESRKLNYFEQQMQILQSQELQSRYIKKFIAKFHYKQDFDIIDQRILSSISKCNDTD